jgi:hypothetical protein
MFEGSILVGALVADNCSVSYDLGPQRSRGLLQKRREF